MSDSLRLAPSRNDDYVYLPGPEDEEFRLNAASIVRDVEGHWIQASGAWQRTARLLIAAASRRR